MVGYQTILLQEQEILAEAVHWERDWDKLTYPLVADHPTSSQLPY